MKPAHVWKPSHATAALLAAALIGGLLVNVVDAASVAITEATVSYGGSNQVVPDDLSNVNSNAVLVSFVAANVTYSDLVLVDNVTANPQDFGTYQYGVNGTDPVSPEAAVTDNRIDSSIANAKTTAEFEFASPPTSLSTVFFLFDLGSLDTGVSIQLIDDSNADIGTPVQMASLAQLGSAVVTSGALGAKELNGVAIPLSDFGITAGQLSSVDGFKFTAVDADPLIAGIAPQPELLVYESFEPASVGTFASGNKGDLTWSTYGGAIVDNKDLTYIGGSVRVNGGDRALFVEGALANTANFASFTFLPQTGDVYFSFLASTTAGVFFQPYVSDDADNSNSGSAVLDTRGGGDLVYARLTEGANTPPGDIGGSQDVNVFIVCKLSKSGAGNYDTLEMLVNPTFHVEPATWTADISRNIGIDAVDTFGIRIWDFHAGEGAWIDEVRIGTTFATVVQQPSGTLFIFK
jgi:hypothetical protein